MSGTRGPDPREARRRYDAMAADYDHQLGPQGTRRGRVMEGTRRRAVAALRLQPGQTVLDVGCGTGSSFARLVSAVGPSGRVVGVDQSEGMLAVASRRIEEERWKNVELIHSPADTAHLPAADAALFFFTHDLLRTPAALDNVVAAVRSEGTIAAAGMQRPRLWLAPIALAAWLVMRRYVTTTDGLARPWDLLAQRLHDVNGEAIVLGAIYIVSGRRPSP